MKVACVVMAVICLLFSLSLAAYCGAKYDMTAGALGIGFAGLLIAGWLLQFASASAKVCAKCGGPLKAPAKRVGRASPPSGEGC